MPTITGRFRVWLIIVGIFFVAFEIKAGDDWVEASSFQSEIASGTLVDVGCIADSVEVGLFKFTKENGSQLGSAIEIRRQRFPQGRGIGGIFYIEPEASVGYSIKIRYKYRFGVEFDPCVRVQRVNHSRYGSYLSLTQTQMSSWDSGGREKLQASLEKVQYALDSLPSEISIYEPLIATVYRLLLELEEFGEIKKKYEANHAGLDVLDVFTKEQIDLLYLIALRELGELDKAETVARVMDKNWEAKNDLEPYRRLTREMVRNELGTALMMSGAFGGIPLKMEEARKVFSLGIEQARQLSDRRLEAMFLNHISPYYFEQDRYEEAERIILESIRLHEQVGSKRLLSDAFNNLARLYQSNEKIEKAVSALSKALEIESDYLQREDIATLQLHLAKLYMDIGDFRRAELYYLSSLDVYSLVGSLFYRAVALKGLGLAQLGNNKSDDGLSNLNLALEYFEQNSHPRYAFHTSISIAKHYILKNGFSLEATNQEFLNVLKTIDEFDSGTPNYEKEKIEQWMLYAELKMRAGADTEYEMYEGLLREFFSRDGSGMWRNEKLRFIDLAMRYRLTRERYDEIENVASEGYQIVEQVSRSLSGSNLGAKWTNRISNIVDLHSQALLKQWRLNNNNELVEKIFALGEKYQATHYRRQKLLESASDAKSSNFIKKENRATIESILRVVNAETNSERDDARKEFLRSDLKLDQSAQSIELKQAQSHTTIRQVQASMNKQDVVFRFVVRKFSSFVIIIHKKNWSVHDLPSRLRLNGLVAQTLSAVSEQRSDATRRIVELSKALSIKKEFLENKSKLIYLADGPLELLPVSLLNMQDENHSVNTIVDSMEVVRIRSISEYFDVVPMPAEPTLEGQDIAIFADPLFQKEALINGTMRSNKKNRTALRSWAKKLSRLPGTAREANAIQRIFPNIKVVTAVGSSATNATFLSEEFRHSKVFHIATHGYFNNRSPNIVGLATAYDPKSEVNSGFLSMAEIAEYKFNANLIVISGCETLLGENVDGEGLIGLDRSLMLQGAGSVIATHWAIPDGSTAYFMKLFYERLKENKGNSSVALSEAKRLMKNSVRYSHPFHWSAFTLTSANRAFDSNVFK